ncbi:hypothetical protein RGU12_15080 [Fredinandcohnia sp. QZ13]|uniref:hypothetical protein n=1 Tax=Fredinandcohnia sp. QZ13 TaxID=3073144 RepID=UPI002853379D|nr:hypothetical protein [Fredinandcohnia sp. QZ13]MDR4888836.1 hypothetical protein [Fredinandcohnia sp. QZ13]
MEKRGKVKSKKESSSKNHNENVSSKKGKFVTNGSESYKKGDETLEYSQQEKHEYLKDTAFILAIITSVSYLISLAYQKGKNTFYGIEGLTNIDLNINSLTGSLFDITSLLLIIVLVFAVGKIIYFLARVGYKKFYKDYDNEVIESFLVMVSNLVLISFIVCWLPFIILGTGDNLTNIMGNYRMFFSILLCILLISTLLCFIFKNHIEKILKPIVAIGKENLLTGLWSRSRLNTRVILGLAMLYLLAIIFFNYGYTQAENEEEYVIFNYNNKDYLLLEKEKSQLIVAPIEKEKDNIIMRKDNINTVELKSDGVQFFNFKTIQIKNGLTVEPNERKKKLDKVNEILNKIR